MVMSLASFQDAISTIILLTGGIAAFNRRLMTSTPPG